ncbi:unnamed protein product [Musa acuminata var. zebrina]
MVASKTWNNLSLSLSLACQPQYSLNHQLAVRTFIPLSEASSLVLSSQRKDEGGGGDSVAWSSSYELTFSDAKEGVDGRRHPWRRPS